MEADGIDEVASPTASALSSLEPSALGRGHELEDTVALARALTGRAPRKTFYRVRAHINPLSSGTCPRPRRPENFAWDEFFEAAGGDLSMPPPEVVRRIRWPTDEDKGDTAPVDILDIGAGFGGLLFGLNLVFPGARKLALEIRGRVAEFVRLKVLAARAAGDAAARRCGVQRVNTMCQLPSFLPLASVSAIFICFPDPHFKRQNHRRRIISPALLSEYAAVLREGGLLFTITDVPALHDWMHTHLEDHPSFEATPAAADDPCVIAMRMATDEARKSLREGRHHQWNVYRRRSDADADAAAAAAGPFFGGYYGGVAVPITEKGVNDAPEMFHWTVLEREAAAKRAKLDGSGGAAGAGAAGAGTAGGAGAAAAASAADESGVGSTQATEAGAASA
ncbi:hypothetical protein FNF29_02694 [Cafeteria roenbergensis]|uniref:tRNA (guanine-N(7)-)-methyltransferase n=1 Tax=Cafeteria roenbergensis TaxID=33653 RepID=A0A5A8CQJ1_CAFRO|nr:hypothetical protein FNF29_02694 [Cafeteria roenbergensis]|eukprot:KAA0154071.1 hypothetical protein FNF29_02694 [Cafeteria roenbergensis]